MTRQTSFFCIYKMRLMVCSDLWEFAVIDVWYRRRQTPSYDMWHYGSSMLRRHSGTMSHHHSRTLQVPPRIFPQRSISLLSGGPQFHSVVLVKFQQGVQRLAAHQSTHHVQALYADVWGTQWKQPGVQIRHCTKSAISFTPTRTTADSNDYVKPWLSTKFGERSFFYRGPLAWNQLLSSIRFVHNISSFKQLLKSHLFRIGFG